MADLTAFSFLKQDEISGWSPSLLHARSTCQYSRSTGRFATKYRHRDAEFSALRIDFLNNTILVLKWAIRHLDLIADFEANFRLDRVFPFPNLRKQLSTSFFRIGIGRSLVPANPITPSVSLMKYHVSHEVIVLIEKIHVHNEISGEKLARRLGLLATLNFLDTFGRNQNLIDVV